MASNLPELTVSELSFALKRTLEDAYGHVRVRGEVSGLKRAASGHLYLSLKDDQAVLDGVCWRTTARRLAFEPEDGLEVVCTGRITTYPARSRYQLVIDSMAPAGVGALMALLEERRKQLAAEGLFAEERKRPLPFLPEVIGVVTSPTGAVIRDILHRIADRFPRRVLVWPVLVQGDQAAAQIAAAIEGFNALEATEVPRPDVLIVARGGGSIEDLWPFNEEVVVRAAAASRIPLVSAVGHETDTTLIDLAADRRAPTPTAAAELCVPVRSELVLDVEQHGGRLHAGIERLLRQHDRHLVGLARGLPDPRTLLGYASQRLDDAAERLPQAASGLLERRRARLSEQAARLGRPDHLIQGADARLQRQGERLEERLRTRLREVAGELRRIGERLVPVEIARRTERHRVELERLGERLDAALSRRLGQQGERLGAVAKLLDGLSHRGVLERGYALVRDLEGRPVTRAAAARRAGALELEFADGRVPVRPAPAPRRQGARATGNQGRLL